MTRGGARVKSGPAKNPQSRTSERAGYTLTALPSEGYTRRPPGLTNYVPKPTARHKAVWLELWRTPQACAWSLDKYKWPSVALLCRLMVRAEDPDAAAAIFSELGKLQTKLGLTEEGMRYLGWAIARDEVAKKAAEKAPAATAPKRERRLRSVGAQ